jgi:hypothetical protein
MSSPSLEQVALQHANFLENMIRKTSFHKNVPTEHLSDHFSTGILPIIEDSISAKDIIFGPQNHDDEDHDEDHDEVLDEIILVGRGEDGYFGYTKTNPYEVIAIALAYRFLDMKLPYDNIGMSRKSGHQGMYASEILDIVDEHTHLEHLLKPCLNIEYDYEKDLEVSFYEMYFCSENLGDFTDKIDYCSTNEEYICELFLRECEFKYKSFTIFSKPEDVFSIHQVNSSSIY